MACGRRRLRKDEGAEPDIATGPRLESPHFFKIILSDTLQPGKLGIPKKFLGRYGNDLSSLVLLKVPGSLTWTIGVEKRNNGTVWLWKGWREFMQHYSIDYGHLVVFKYEGNSTFCVMIFDKSASEIDYSSSGISNLGSGSISPKREDVIELDDSEDCTPRQKMRVEPHAQCSQSCSSCSSQDLEDRVGQSRSKASHSKPVFGGSASPWPLSSFELASEFDSEHPFFNLVIRLSHIKRDMVNVPRSFVMQHIRKIKEIATLSHSDRTWPVKLSSYPSGAIFSSGWMAFVKGTRLHVGNVCVFELIDKDDIVFRVYIFSSAGRNKQPRCRMNHSEPVCLDPTLSRPLTTLELADEFDSEHPFFKLVIHPGHFKIACCADLVYIGNHMTCYFFGSDRGASQWWSDTESGKTEVNAVIRRSGLSIHLDILDKLLHHFPRERMDGHLNRHIPCRFAEQHLEEFEGTATLRYSDGSWPVKLLRNLHGTGAYFSAGWPAFARETHLRVGNACVFELINRDDVVFKVSIFKNGGEDLIHID